MVTSGGSERRTCKGGCVAMLRPKGESGHATLRNCCSAGWGGGVTAILADQRAEEGKENQPNITGDPGGCRPQRPLSTGADACKTGSGAGKRAEAENEGRP